MAAKLLAPRWFARAIKGGNEENVLCQVDANCHRLVHGLLLSPFGSSRCIASISWRIDAVEGRGRRPSHRAPARPRGAAPLCHTNTHIELIIDASESRTSIDPDIMARSTLSPSSVPQQGIR